jgi:hypothetical protein
MPPPSPVPAVTLNDLAAAASTHADPNLTIDGNTGLTIDARFLADQVEIRGNCLPQSRVALSGAALSSASLAECESGRYSSKVARALGRLNQQIIATQLLLDGSIIAAQADLSDDSKPKPVTLHPNELAAALLDGRANGSIRLEPGTYADLRLRLPQDHNLFSHPIQIDGAGQVTLTGQTRIVIDRDAVTLSGISFEDTGESTVTIHGSDVRLTRNTFFRCGRFDKPQSQCILASPTARRTEIDFNKFSGSLSMSIKLRAANDSAQDQTKEGYIHHNIFRDINRNSDNGQEPIQIAGPNGAGSAAILNSRIEHNLFIRANGDREAISLKTTGTRVLWNVFYQMDAAPNLRGAADSRIVGNIMIRTRSLRIAGRQHLIRGNLLLCLSRISVELTHGSAGYANAENNTISDNLLVASKGGVLFSGQQEGVSKVASNNEISNNMIITEPNGFVIRDRLGEPNTHNTLFDNRTSRTYRQICKR